MYWDSQESLTAFSFVLPKLSSMLTTFSVALAPSVSAMGDKVCSNKSVTKATGAGGDGTTPTEPTPQPPSVVPIRKKKKRGKKEKIDQHMQQNKEGGSHHSSPEDSVRIAPLLEKSNSAKTPASAVDQPIPGQSRQPISRKTRREKSIHPQQTSTSIMSQPKEEHDTEARSSSRIHQNPSVISEKSDQANVPCPEPSTAQCSQPDQEEQSTLQDTPPLEKPPKKKGDPSKLTLVTWNIDGLEKENMKERFSKLLDYLIEYHPDVVLLQEVIPPLYKILKSALKPYHVLPGGDDGYFTAILLRKTRVQLVDFDIMIYPGTNMSRNLLTANVLFADHALCLMTSHLESMRNNFQERVKQVLRVWKRMSEQPSDCNVIFGGDTNLRDNEVLKTLGGLPDDISDVWEDLGRPEDCRYTWDLVTNNNKVLPFPARLRFDRLFLRQAWEGAKVIPAGMTLVGMERLDCGCFTSDHWGILCTFDMELLIQRKTDKN